MSILWLEVLQSKQRVDLLVTDCLPGLNRGELDDAGREWRPDLKVMLMTRNAENATLAAGYLEPGMQMITIRSPWEGWLRIKEIVDQ